VGPNTQVPLDISRGIQFAMEFIKTGESETVLKISYQFNGPALIANKGFKINAKREGLYTKGGLIGRAIRFLGHRFLRKKGYCCKNTSLIFICKVINGLKI
jgi:hypothetical protein